jgi:hypothetical protein
MAAIETIKRRIKRADELQSVMLPTPIVDSRSTGGELKPRATIQDGRRRCKVAISGADRLFLQLFGLQNIFSGGSAT